MTALSVACRVPFVVSVVSVVSISFQLRCCLLYKHVLCSAACLFVIKVLDPLFKALQCCCCSTERC